MNQLFFRIDVYVNGVFRAPINAEMKNGELEYRQPAFFCEYCPELPNVANGDNFQVGVCSSAVFHLYSADDI